MERKGETEIAVPTADAAPVRLALRSAPAVCR
jgi:hypothetical protein